MALDVKVTINLSKPVGKVGTWIPLIYVPVDPEDGQQTVEAVYNECSNIDEVVSAGYADGTEAYAVASLIFMQENAPATIAILKGGKTVQNVLPNYLYKNWHQLIVLSDYDATLAAYIETTDKMYFTHFTTQAELETAYKATSNPLKGFDNTFSVLYTDEKVKYPEAAVVGATSGLAAGSFTYKNIVIKGISALDKLVMTDEAIKKAHENGAITIVEKAGDIVTSEGIVGSGEYADVVDSKNYIIQNIAYKTQKVFNNNAKVPYTDAGIGMLESATLEALVDGYNNGMIADNDDGTPAYFVSFALRKDTSETDRGSRNYPYGAFKFELAGAIHSVNVVGEIEV